MITEPYEPYPDEPPSPRPLQRRPIAQWLAELRDRRERGRWYRLPGDYVVSTASNIRRGKYPGTKRGEFAARYERVPERPTRALIWVAWLDGER